VPFSESASGYDAFVGETRTIRFTVAAEQGGQRVDVFLAEALPWRSRQSLVELLGRGAVQRNGALVKKACRLRPNDEIAVCLPMRDEVDDVGVIELDILFEDEDLVVINKPANVAVHPASTCVHRNVLRRLVYRYERELPDPYATPSIIHRLDRTTSGVIAFARRRAWVPFYMHQFERRTARKEYIAVVHGQVSQPGRIETPIRIVPDRPVVVDPDGKPSRTDFAVIEVGRDASMLRITLHTGRKHQIRAHLAFVGHPIVYDDVYGGPRDASWPEDATPLLHAASLELEHRRHGPMRFEAPTPNRMSMAWQLLGG